MQELLFILVLAIATFFAVYVSALAFAAVSGVFMVLKYFPEEIWTVILLALTIATMRGLRYSTD